MQLLQYHGYMNLTLPAAIVDRLPYLSGGAIKTYVALSVVKSKINPFPTQDDLAVEMNVSPRSVTTYLKELERAGYIKKRRIGSGRRTDYAFVNTPRYGE